MKKKKRKTTSVGQKSLRQTRAEKQAIKQFNAELQIAVEGVDWSKVKVSRLH